MPLTKEPLPDPGFLTIFPPNDGFDYFEAWRAHPFAPEKITFEPVNAWRLAELALLTYSDPERVRRAFNRPDLASQVGLTFFNRGSTQGFVAAHANFVVVAFRGTEVKPQERFDVRNIIKDVLTNADLLLDEWDGAGRVHKGFKMALDAVWESQTGNPGLKDMIAKIVSAGPNRPVWFTGHSLGGAVATLAADRFGRTFTNAKAKGLYTFGSPRVGNAGFWWAFDLPTFRVVNDDDIVTNIPFGWYRHVGDAKHFDRDGRLRDGSGFLNGIGDFAWGNVLYSLPPRPLDFIPFKAISDHAPIYYVLKCRNLLA